MDMRNAVYTYICVCSPAVLFTLKIYRKPEQAIWSHELRTERAQQKPYQLSLISHSAPQKGTHRPGMRYMLHATN